MTLTEFLLARIAEDEAAAKATLDEDGERWIRGVLRYSDRYDSLVMLNESEVPVAEADEHIAEHVARHDPARVLAECEAKRRIVERLVDHWEESGGWGSLMEDIARDLAAPYADHPDYRDEWSPNA